MLDEKLHNLTNVLKADQFLIQNGVAEGVVTHTATGVQVKCPVSINWSPGKWMQFVCSKSGDKLIPFYNNLNWEVEVRARISKGAFEGWHISTECAVAKNAQMKNNIESGLYVSLAYEHTPSQLVCLNPCRKITDRRDDVLVYWIPNFIFDGMLTTSISSGTTVRDGFQFEYGKNNIIFRHGSDDKEISKSLKSKNISSAITSVMEVRGPLVSNKAFRGRFERAIFTLIEALEGSRIRPLAMARYSSKGKLKHITWQAEHAADYYSHRFLMANRIGRCSWAEFLRCALPGFMKYYKKLDLPSACWQMVEARSSLCVQSSIAISLMCLENMSTRYLHEKGITVRRAPLEQKLNRANKTLKCFPKSFRRSLPEIRDELRNPLFHEGRTQEQEFKVLMDYYYQLINACAVLLCAICGYRGSLVFAVSGGNVIMTLDEYAGS